jgi:cytochrome b561/polyisoprenoid-binding protein YceI
MTDSPQSPTRYSTIAIVLHWALALLLLFQLALGWRLADLPRGSGETFAAFQLHKSIGISILLLSLARLALRWWKPRPAPWQDSRFNMVLAKGVHWLLYLVMVGGPLTGWILVSTSRTKVATMLFGILPWPHLPVGRSWHEPAEVSHSVLAWLLVGLFVLHVAGALRHHVLREDLLGRMLPARLASHGALTAGAIVALAGTALAFAAGQWVPLGKGGAAAVSAAAPAQLASQAPAETAAPKTTESASASPGPDASESAAAAAVPWVVEPGGRLAFRADYSGSPVDGSFGRWDADIRFSPDDLENSRVRVTIDLASADTADGERDAMLKGDSFFNTAAHPRATFVSSRIRERGAGRYSAAGTLTMHGASRPVTLDFDLRIDGDRASSSGSARLSRTAFGVGSGEWAATDQIADGVSVNFRLKARRSKQ